MIKIVLSKSMGKRFASIGRGLKEATSAIIVVQRADGNFVHGVGVLYPDTEHLYFNKTKTIDPLNLWRGMYAVSKISCLSNEMVDTAMMIADEVVSLTDSRFTNVDQHLMYEYDVEVLRAKTFAQEIPPDDIKKIVKEFQFWNLPIIDPFAKASKKEGRASWDIIPHMTSAEMNDMSLAT